MNCNFSFNHYNELMESVRENGYRPIFFHEDDDGKCVLVRHDIDQDIESAYELAKIEHLNGVKATYFLWLNSPFYNIFDVKYSNIIKDILALGHEIGLHFDETAYVIDNLLQMQQYIDKEKEIMESYFETSIKSVSFHRPSNFILQNDVEIKELANTYSKKFFKDFKYISDSRGIWREGCLCNLLKENKYEKIQVLTHPIWWNERPLNNHQSINELIELSMDKMEEELVKNISIYKRNNG